MSEKRVTSLMRKNPTREEHRAIRREWIAHSIAEDARDIPGLMATLTEDCEYILVNTGETWQGKEGATRFYTEMLAAMPDVHFDLQQIVIGPQGVWEEANVTATLEGGVARAGADGRAGRVRGDDLLPVGRRDAEVQGRARPPHRLERRHAAGDGHGQGE